MTDDIFTELNRDYYSESPASYLRTRITLLVALGDTTRPIHTGLAGGLTAWGVTARADDAHDQDEIDGYAVVESISLMYLAAEALVRVFLAHVNRPQCPPLTLGSLTNFREFKNQASTILKDPPTVETLRDVFRGAVAIPDGITDEDWAEDGEVLQYLLARAADLILNHAHVYNSTKHGLAVQSRKSAVKLGRDDDPGGPAIDHAGPAVRFLSKGRRDGAGVEAWAETLQFEFPAINLALASAFADELEAVHAIGAARFRNETVQLSIQKKSLIAYVQTVPFRGGRTGLLGMSFTRSFSVRVTG